MQMLFYNCFNLERKKYYWTDLVWCTRENDNLDFCIADYFAREGVVVYHLKQTFKSAHLISLEKYEC